jgi:cell volume regulation protein A
VRPVIGHGLALSTLGVLITALLMGTFAALALGFPWLEGLLLGAVVSSTDAAAVFAVLRSRSVRLRSPLEPLLELESGSNDPMAVFLTMGLVRLMTSPSLPPAELLLMFVQQMALGALLGYVGGRATTFVVNHLRLSYEGLYPVLMLACALLTYGLTASLGGNGFLAVYLAGIVIGNRDFVHKKSLLRFHDGLAWLMQIAMFLSLGLLVFPSRLPAVVGDGLLASLFLMFVARPLSVFLTLWWARLGWRELTMIGWVGLRGAVPIILATFPLLARIPHADTIFNLVFFIVLSSVLLQGTSLPRVSRWLGVAAPEVVRHRYPLEFVPEVSVNSQLIEVVIPPEAPVVGRSILQLGLPPGALILLIGRGGENLVPNGGTVLEADDRLLVLAEKEAIPAVRSLCVQAACEQPASRS